MKHYIPLFSKIVDSSLWDESDTVIKVFLSMLAKKEKGNVVIASAYAISRWARKTEAETLEALKILSSPDTRRLEPQPFEGRRIEKVEGGWLILNGGFYQHEMQKLNRREYNRNKQQEHRNKKKATFERDFTAQVNSRETASKALAPILQKAVEQSPEIAAQLGVNQPLSPDLQKTIIQD